MSGDELAAALFEEQGYVLIGSHNRLEIGECYNATNKVQMQTPFIPVAEVTPMDWNIQQGLVKRLLGRPMVGKYAHYYRVEAVD